MATSAINHSIGTTGNCVDYNLEALGDERFQKLCQALLTNRFPNVQCLPVGQPDGGRDAFIRQPIGFMVFQVKYSRNPGSKNERIAISDVISSEKPKVDELIKRGATAFYLMTNVSGTSHLDGGSIDKINSELTDAFGIPSFCWWRDDIERRVESTTGLIWRYPEIFKGSDFLEILTSGRAAPLAKTKTNTFRAYLSAQYIKEAEVRFQQVKIQSSLLDLFTDTPIGASREKLPPPDTCLISQPLMAPIVSAMQNQRYRHGDGDGSETLAAAWLLAVAPEKGLQRIVLEGAPGQGKSTVTQYLAQIQRMRSLGKEQDAPKVPEQHLGHAVRLPLRVDLRDYATWLIGNDPFASEKEVPRPPFGLDALESFMYHQIFTISGGREFSVTDLTAMLDDSHCLLILDGFDEVADKATRARLIEQIRSGSERLGSDCGSLQVIVTSRPAAFILSPGFPEREWLHLSLLPMRLSQIGEYTDKWIAVRNLPVSEGREFKELLLDRVARSHIRSLAQNPMQLAILLSLISTKGRSLPDKRTALYDSYMDLFFGREAEKDETVRENRDVLIQIHQYVAWTLQLDAEKPGGSGSISQSELEALVRQFLIDKEHDGDVLKLFTGAVERVGALVSRVQGMLEFEVQPLREYFTGRYLYETTPYSPAGAEKGGTRPQRFDALARRPYWLNVARFYAGCYNSGELSSLVSGLEQLQEGANLTLSSHALQLAVLFLNDWVFAQEPKTVRDVVRFLTSKKNLRLLIASRASWEEDRLALPEKSGRRELAAEARASFLAASEAAYLSRLGMLIRLNLSLGERWKIWQEVRDRGDDALFHASCLGLFVEVNGSQQRTLIETYGDDARQSFIICGRWDALDPSDRAAALNSLANQRPSSSMHRRSGRTIESEVDLYRVYIMLNPYSYSFLSFTRGEQTPFNESLMRHGFYLPHHSKRDVVEENETGLFDVMTAAVRASRASTDQWGTSLEPWSDFVESARRTWGDGTRTYCLAATAAGIISKADRAAGFSDVLDEKLPLVERARYARLKPAVSWWKGALTDATTDGQRLWILILLLGWAPSAVIKGLESMLTIVLTELDDDRWGDLIYAVRAVISSTFAIRQPLSGFDEAALSSVASPRLKALLILRLPRTLSLRALTELLDGYNGQDQQLGAFLASAGMREAQREPKIWKNLITFFESYTSGPLGLDDDHVLGPERFYIRPHDGVPASVALEMAETQDRLPIGILEIVVRNLSRRSGAAVNALGRVALDEKWFG